MHCSETNSNSTMVTITYFRGVHIMSGIFHYYNTFFNSFYCKRLNKYVSIFLIFLYLFVWLVVFLKQGKWVSRLRNFASLLGPSYPEQFTEEIIYSIVHFPFGLMWYTILNKKTNLNHCDFPDIV